MSENVTRTQTMQIIGDHVHDLRRKMESTDSSIIELGKSMVAVQKDTTHVKESADKLNATLDKLAAVFDMHNEKIRSDIIGLKLWRSLTAGGFIICCSIFGFFKESIIHFLFNTPSKP